MKYDYYIYHPSIHNLLRHMQVPGLLDKAIVIYSDEKSPNETRNSRSSLRQKAS